MSALIDELRPLTAARLLSIRKEIRAQTEEELELEARCNARVLAEACFAGGRSVFNGEEDVLEQLTFPEMEQLLSRLASRRDTTSLPAAVNAQFDERRFSSLRNGMQGLSEGGGTL